jgi:hypothetical protein
MTFTPENLAQELQSVAAQNLRSVVLYGSAAAGDHVGKRSDYNVLVVLDRLGVEELLSLSNVSARWAKAGNPPPLLFTQQQLKVSADVFPIELADMRDSRRILYGEDPLEKTVVSLEPLRHELEHQLRGKLIQLRERFLLAGGKPAQVRELLVNSLSTFLVLFRAALRLQGGTPPVKKMEALAALRKHIDFDDEVFRRVEEIKEGRKHKETDALLLFARYLKAVETVAEAVDGWTQQRT